HWLKKAGYVVQTATNGREGLELLEHECPRFLITDWEMPEISGIELCRKVRSLALPHYVYIVFVTGRSATEEIVQGFDVGADDFLHKPVRQSELLARLHAGERVLALEHRLQQMARTDALTGLLTQRSFYEIAEKEFARAKRHRTSLSCVMVDLDYFKRINDVHGHPAGDAVLRTVADVLRQSTRKCDILARYGGEEFCILLPETDERNAEKWTDRFRKQLSSTHIDVGDTTLQVTASLGIAEVYDDTLTAEMLVDQADQALLCAKRSGRDRAVRFQSLSETAHVDLDQPGTFGNLFHGVTAEQVMTPIVAPMRHDMPIGDAADYFLRSRITSTPVVDDDGELIGILSEKDLMAALVTLKSWDEPVSKFMRPHVITYEADTPIRSIYEFMCRVAIRRIIIVRDGRPIGAISRGTLLRWFRNMVTASGMLAPERVDQLTNRPRRLSHICHGLAEQTERLQQAIEEEQNEDRTAYVVGIASQMQELLNDLLAFSREGNAGAGALGAAMLAQGMMTD
ncbi:MAG: diguanylate cyclase, partial [Planctomycetota bacterium]